MRFPLVVFPRLRRIALIAPLLRVLQGQGGGCQLLGVLELGTEVEQQPPIVVYSWRHHPKINGLPVVEEDVGDLCPGDAPALLERSERATRERLGDMQPAG